MTAIARPVPDHRAIGSAIPGETRAVVRWLALALFAAIFLQRFALPGSGGIALSLFVTLAVVAALAVRGSLRVDPMRAALFLVFACCMSLSVAANADDASTNSVLLVVLLYAPFSLSLRVPHDVFPACVRTSQHMVLICAVCGIAQYLGAIRFQGPGLFSFNGTVPDALLIPNYNTVIPLQWGVTIYKSNGFFFLEPSIFSQFLSLSIVLEVLFFGATARLIIFGVALLFTYSGTGPLMLAMVLPCLMLHRRAYRLMAGLTVFAALALATGKLWGLDVILQRSAEFGAEDSSATARFIAGAWLIADTMRWTPHDLLFGLGPGTFRQFGSTAAYAAHDAAWAKLLFEYGPLGSVAFWAFFGYAMFNSAPSGWVAAALTIGFLTFGGMVLDPRLNTLILVLCVLPKLLSVDLGAIRLAGSASSPGRPRMTPPPTPATRQA